MNIANKLTIGRAVAIPFFIFFLMTDFVPGSKWIALGLFIVASFTDFLDGYIARKYNMVSNFGKFMDPLADKLLVCSALIGLLALGEINVYLVMIIIARDFIISGFRLIAAENGIVIAANMWGKLKTVAQMIMIIVLIANFDFPVLFKTLANSGSSISFPSIVSNDLYSPSEITSSIVFLVSRR